MTLRTTMVAFATAVGLMAASGSASAQTRQGFWFGVGGGYGSANATCDDCGSGQRENSGVTYLNGGYTVNPHVLLGVEFGLWAKTFDFEGRGSATMAMYHVSATATYYPQRSGGLFIKGGAGGAMLNTNVKVTGSSVSFDTATGPSFIVGGGYDIPIGRIALTPAVNYWYGQLGDVKLADASIASNFKQNVVSVTFGVTLP